MLSSGEDHLAVQRRGPLGLPPGQWTRAPVDELGTRVLGQAPAADLDGPGSPCPLDPPHLAGHRIALGNNGVHDYRLTRPPGDQAREGSRHSFGVGGQLRRAPGLDEDISFVILERANATTRSPSCSSRMAPIMPAQVVGKGLMDTRT